MKGLISSIKEAVNLPRIVKEIYSHRELIFILTWRDFRARFQGSFGGLLWAVVQPLVMMLIYTLVFSVFLKVRFGNNASPFNFAVFLLCGMLPWTAFAECFQNSTNVIRGNVNLVKRVVFPLDILPFNLVMGAIIQQFIGFIILIPLIWISNGRLHSTLLYYPVLLLIQILLYIGTCWIWASLSTYIPDLRQLTPVILSIAMYLTPIFYPISAVPARLAQFLMLNPFAILISLYRDILINGTPPEIAPITGLFFFSLLIFMVGYTWFDRTKRGFADIL